MPTSKTTKKTRITKKQQQQQERNELARIQRQMADKRFPSSSKMNLTQRIDRLEVCNAQTLAAIDKFMVYFEERHCPFVDNNNHLPSDKQQQPITTTTTEPTTNLDNNGPNYPYL